MKRQCCFLIACLIPFLSFAQSESAATSSSRVDAEVWKPFCEAYNAFDAEGFNAVHTDDVLRLSPTRILKGEEYKANMRSSFSREGQAERRIDLRFEHRVYKDELGYEVGYYRVRYFEDGKETQAHVGRFHVLLKKVNGTWKIAQDWDSSNINGRALTEEDFERLPEPDY